MYAMRRKQLRHVAMNPFMTVSSVHSGTLWHKWIYGGYNDLAGLKCSVALDSKQQYKDSACVQNANQRQKVKLESYRVSQQCKGSSFTQGLWG